MGIWSYLHNSFPHHPLSLSPLSLSLPKSVPDFLEEKVMKPLTVVLPLLLSLAGMSGGGGGGGVGGGGGGGGGVGGKGGGGGGVGGKGGDGGGVGGDGGGGGGVCTTVECLDVAYEVKRSLDFGLDPCGGFYQFTCSGFLNDTRFAR